MDDPRWKAVVDDQRSLWDGEGSSWIVLPDEIGFVAVSSDNESTRRMREILRAFLGRHRVGDPLVKELEIPEGRSVAVHRFAVTPADMPEVLDRLARLVFVRRQNPRVVAPIANALPTLLRDFFLTLATHSESEALRLLSRVVATGRLSIENVRFLEVRMLASFGHWESIQAADDFRDLCRMLRPQVISDVLLEALWRMHLSEIFELNGDDATRDHFAKKGLAKEYRTLLDAISLPSRARSRLMLAVHLGARGDIRRFEDLLNGAPESERPRLWALSGFEQRPQTDPEPQTTQPQSSEHDLETEARDLFDDGDFFQVIRIFLDDPRSARIAVLALESVAELGNAELARDLLAAIVKHGIELPERKRVQQLVRSVRNMTNAAISDWADWANRINAESLPGINRVMLDESQMWSLDFLDDSTKAEAVATAIEASIDGPNGQAVNTAIASLVQLAAARPDAPYAGRIRSAVLLLIVSLDNAGASLREAVLELLRSARDGEWTPQELADSVDVVQTLWIRSASPFAVPWLVQALDEIISLPGMTAERAHEIRTLIGRTLVAVHLRADRVWLRQLKDLLEDCFMLPWDGDQSGELDGNELDRVPWEALSGVRLGVYSLHHRIGQVEHLLEGVVPQLRLTIRQDVAWTEQMRDMMRNSDAFFFHWRKASHAGTELVRRYAIFEPIMVPGSSVSSVLRCIEDYARKRHAIGATA